MRFCFLPGQTRENINTIAVAGAGYAGFAIATPLSLQHKVYIVDVIVERLNPLNNRRSAFQFVYRKVSS